MRGVQPQVVAIVIKDYRHGSGLFGRTRGVFWWDAQNVSPRDYSMRVKAPFRCSAHGDDHAGTKGEG